MTERRGRIQNRVQHSKGFESVVARLNFVVFAGAFIALGAAESSRSLRLFEEAGDRIFKVGVAASASAEFRSTGTGFVVDLTPEMLEMAASKKIYRSLSVGSVEAHGSIYSQL